MKETLYINEEIMIKENLELVKRNIDTATIKSGRESGDVTLIAVSKTKPVEMVKEAYDLGVRDFGENKAKELLEKREILPDDIRWHMIGHLQTNKVKSLIGKTYLIHSIDSIHLADCIDTESAKAGIITEGLIEINVGMEESKHGFAPEIYSEVLERFAQYKHLKIRGLMTVAPDLIEPNLIRPYFEKLRGLSVDIGAKNIDNICMDYLSMGMTGDYELAIEEGANFVRVGTGIFGNRERIE